MSNNNALLNVSSKELKRAIALKERIERLQSQLERLLGATGATAPARGTGRRTMSAAARARIAAAQRARWAKLRGGKKPAVKAGRGRRKMSAAARARLSAIARARWAKVKKSGGKRL